MKPVIKYSLSDETWEALHGSDSWVGCYSHLFQEEHFKKIDDKLTELVENEIKEYNYEYSLEGKNWDRDNLSVVVFIQDVSTKEVYQAVTDENN